MEATGETGEPAPKADADEIYDLAPLDEPLAAIPIAETPFSHNDLAGAGEPLTYQSEPDQPSIDTNPEFASPVRDFWLPIASIGIAFILALAAGLNHSTLRLTLAGIGCYAIVKATIMIISVPLMLRFAGVAFGRLASGMLKFTAIALLPDAIGIVIFSYAGSIYTWLAIPFIIFALLWFLFGVLFELDWVETKWCLMILMLVSFTPILIWGRLFDRLWEIAT